MIRSWQFEGGSAAKGGVSGRIFSEKRGRSTAVRRIDLYTICHPQLASLLRSRESRCTQPSPLPLDLSISAACRQSVPKSLGLKELAEGSSWLLALPLGQNSLPAAPRRQAGICPLPPPPRSFNFSDLQTISAKIFGFKGVSVFGIFKERDCTLRMARTGRRGQRKNRGSRRRVPKWEWQ